MLNSTVSFRAVLQRLL